MSSNTIRNITWDKCTGCCLCQNVCPVEAIKMEENFQGFIHPVIDDSKCIDCGKCLKKCPVREPVYKNTAEPECRAVWANDEIRLSAASGGMFSVFAKVILERGGVICGAAYDEGLSVKHIIAEDITGLEKIKSSKYVQSTAGMVYKKIKEFLDMGREVLFSGCPCQVAALNSYLDYKEYDNLYTMDLVCHGVPSPAALRQYLKENFQIEDIEKIDFRDKSYYGWSSSVNVYLKNQQPYRRSHKDDVYLRAFLNGLSVRKSCGSCPFSIIPRQGDVSIGDFWGVSSIDPKLNDKKGTSLILVNNKNGRKIMQMSKKYLTLDKSTGLSPAKKFNRALYDHFQSHPARKRFFENLGKVPYSVLVDKCLTHHYDIGIVGLWYGLNYGSILTYYALYSVVNAMGYDAIMINKPQELWSPKYADKNTIANKFIYQHCYVSNIRKSYSDWQDLSDHCDTFIVGSDVVWNYQICGRESKQFFFLDFVDDDKKKIAMASSFGAGYDAPEKERILSSYYLKKFDHIGVREEEGVDICKKQFGVDADRIMDPVFLCDKNIYHRLADNSKNTKSGKYIASYILGPDLEKKEILKRSSNILEMPLISIANPNNPKSFTERTGLPSLDEPSVEDWLFYIKNADFFIGDSFHGLCFALIFNIPFLIILNTNISGLARFTTLLGMLDLEDRLMFSNKDDFSDKEKLLTEKIDYTKVNKILASRSEESYQWLLSAIRSPKRYKASAQEIIINELREKIQKLEKDIQDKK